MWLVQGEAPLVFNLHRLLTTYIPPHMQLKQEAAFATLKATKGKSSVLSFEAMLQLMHEPWAVAFSREANLKAWSIGGFGAEGITMGPLWKQKAAEDGVAVRNRAMTQAEKRKVSQQVSAHILHFVP